MKRVDPLISSCPACRKNFYDFFCQFSCSPNESQFVEIIKTETARDTGKEIVTEINQYVEPGMANQFLTRAKRKVPGNQRLRNGFDWWWCKELSAIFKVLGDENHYWAGLLTK